MRVMVFGVRGFPGVEGGIESHAENLYPLLSHLGCSIEVLARSRYCPHGNIAMWRGVHLVPLWAPSSTLKGLEAFSHSLLAVLVAGIRRPHLLHIHGLGPSLMVPLARILGLRVVVTNHGPDYESSKWGRFARLLLETGEMLGMRLAHRRIAVSGTVRDIIVKKHRCDAVVIANGVCVQPFPDTQIALHRFGLHPKKYILMVSRFVAHKRHQDLIRAFEAARLPGWKLVLVGGRESRDAYTSSVVSLAEQSEGVILTGYQGQESLRELYAHAGLFALPSAYEGLPIAALEALSFGLSVLLSDIPAHREIGLPPNHYFPLGDTAVLTKKLLEFKRAGVSETMRDALRVWVKDRYDWSQIARQTLQVYEEACKPEDSQTAPSGYPDRY